MPRVSGACMARARAGVSAPGGDVEPAPHDVTAPLASCVIADVASEMGTAKSMPFAPPSGAAAPGRGAGKAIRPPATRC